MSAPQAAASGWRRRGAYAALALALLGAAVSLLARGFGVDPHAVPSVLGGLPLPPFSLRSLDGNEVSNLSLRGRPVLINFWSSWCIPCRAEHALLQEAATTYGDDVAFIGVIFQDDAAAIARQVGRHDRFVHLEDPGSRLAIDLGVAGVPESFLVDAHGQIVHKQVGVWQPQVLREWLERLKGEREAR